MRYACASAIVRTTKIINGLFYYIEHLQLYKMSTLKQCMHSYLICITPYLYICILKGVTHVIIVACYYPAFACMFLYAFGTSKESGLAPHESILTKYHSLTLFLYTHETCVRQYWLFVVSSELSI